MEGKEEKKTKKKLIAIITIIIVIVIIAAIGGYFLYQKLELEKPIETEWGEIYYSYVKEATIEETKTNEEIGITDDMQNMQLQFCGVNQKEDPLMLLSYTKEGETYHNIYQIDNGYVSYTKIGEPSMVELLYSVEEKQYHWYLHEENETQDTYQPLENIINANQENKLPEYTIGKGEETSVETVNGEKLSVSKYDETFIKPEVEENKKVDFTTDLEEKEMKEAIEGLVTDYKSEEEIITEEVKQEVAKKETELTEQKDKMQAAEEERKQKEEEEIKITQENFQEKLKEHLKWFSYAYMGVDYGTYQVYEIKDRTNEVTIPGTDSEYMMTEELVGAKSIQNIRSTMNSYVSQNAISKIQSQSMWYAPGETYTSNLHDYNGKVYIIRGGIGGGPMIDHKDTKVLSSEGGVTKIELADRDSLGGMIEARITITVEYNKETQKYMITDCEIKNLY